MANLTVNNFLSIKKANIELKRITVIIGPQAQGKSVITKLVSFFKDIPYMVFEAGMDEKSKRQFDSELRAKFELMFPRYTWEKTKFHIQYYSSVLWMDIECVGGKLVLNYDEDIQKALSAARKVARRASEEPEMTRKRRSPVREIREAVLAHLNSGWHDPRLESVVYIPAGRSFFANLHKNVFSFLSSNIPIDYFLKDFGAIYERTRDFMMNGFFRNDVPKGVSKLVDDLVCGKYVVEKGQDWIVSDRGRVSVSNSSSGQQEVLPMALMLSTWPYANYSQIYRSFVIEEPEAHLFPVAQGQIVSLIASAYKAGDSHSDYIVTTHSPYILTALNNLIQAHNVLRAMSIASKEKLSELNSLVPKEQQINFDDVAAYMISGGISKAILDPELRLIDAGAIDSVSNVFAEKFEKLIDMEISE